MDVLARLSTSNLETFVAVTISAVGADDICTVKGEGEAVNAAGHGGESVLADPVVGVPERYQGVATAYGEEVARRRMLDRVCRGCMCVECVEERLCEIKSVRDRRDKEEWREM